MSAHGITECMQCAVGRCTHMVPVAQVMRRHAAHILLGGPDVRVRLQICVRVMPHNVLLPPQE